LSIAALALIVAGCGFTGPRTLEIGRPLYNLAVQRTNTEQLLLNLVRLRYRDTPLFLQVASVSSSYEIETEAEAAVQLEGGMRSIWNLFFGGRVMEVPTVTYTPLQGQAFVRQLMDGIDLETLLRLYHSGWGVDRIFRVCLQEMNDVPNAPTASGPTPSEAPEYEDFLEVVRALRRLQQQRVLELGSSADERELVLLVAPRSIDSPEWHTVTRILSLPPGTDRFRLSIAVRRTGPGHIQMVNRSLAGVFFYLSHGVEVPPEDEAAGRVTVTRYPTGEPFDWSTMTGDLLRVRSSRVRPPNARIRARYRGAWFYIDDSDLSSKSTFALLSQLFALQGGDVPSTGPLLTLPVAR
jgi:hypothetical protein